MKSKKLYGQKKQPILRKRNLKENKQLQIKMIQELNKSSQQLKAMRKKIKKHLPKLRRTLKK